MDSLYTPQSIPNFDYINDLGDPGQAPYTRGIYTNMYKGKEFTMRQLTGFGSPEDTNKRMKFMLENGATGLSVLFDFPTIQMYDSDDKVSEGHIGFSGVCVDSIEDMYALFAGIDISKVSISIVTHYPTNTSILFSMFLAMVEEKKLSYNELRGSVQNDATMEEVVRCGAEFISPKNCFRIQCDNFEYIMENIPKWNPITLNGYNLRECGTSAVTEMAVAISNGIATINEMVLRRHTPSEIASKIAFFWSIDKDFFEEVARLRAVRRLWYKLMKYKFNITEGKGLLMRCHVQTSGISLTKQEPLNNIVRSAYQALSAVLGGVQSLHVDSYDEAYSVPTEEAALISLRTQQIIQDEIGVTDVIDPLGGSYYIEALTNKMEKEILDEVDKIENDGGYLSLIESGKLHRDVSIFAYEQQKKMEDGSIHVIGVNKYKQQNINTPIEGFKYPLKVEERQKNRLILLRAKRDNEKVKKTLADLERVCGTKENIIPYCIECAKARCTEGEMFKSFKSAFGLWKEKNTWQ